MQISQINPISDPYRSLNFYKNDELHPKNVTFRSKNVLEGSAVKIHTEKSMVDSIQFATYRPNQQKAEI